VVLPGAEKNESGEWDGIFKMPLPPEFRALNGSVWRGVMDIANGSRHLNPASASMALFDTITGGIRTLDNPYKETFQILNGRDPRTGEELVKGQMRDLPTEEQVYEWTSNAGKNLSAGLRAVGLDAS